jgi:hypothetical protein
MTVPRFLQDGCYPGEFTALVQKSVNNEDMR